MLRKFLVFSCLGVLAMSMAACSGPGEVSAPPAEEQIQPGNTDVPMDDPNSGRQSSFE